MTPIEQLDAWQYLLVMAGCLLVTLPLEFVLNARVYRRWRLLLWSLLPVAAVFVVWDVIAIARGHWWYSPRYTTGILLPGGLPLEELVFFLVIPICGLLTYEAVGTVLGRRVERAQLADSQSGAARSEPADGPRPEPEHASTPAPAVRPGSGIPGHHHA
ncbi:MAG: lycopene cyclase domain-containing protein [Candidatus Nanopelagicales bacterium]